MGQCGSSDSQPKGARPVKRQPKLQANQSPKVLSSKARDKNTKAVPAGLGLYTSGSLRAEGFGVEECPSCKRKVPPGLLPFCPLDMKVCGTMTVSEAVTKLNKKDRKSLSKCKRDSNANLYYIVKIQRWYKKHRLYKLWLGSTYQYLYNKLDKWLETRLLTPGTGGKVNSMRVTDVADAASPTSSDELRWPIGEIAELPEKEVVVRAVISIVSDNKIVPAGFLKQLLIKSEAHLSQRPNIQYVKLKETTRCIVVGDLHGQLADLLHIIREFDLPSENRIYIFNGDFVDRGTKGCEVTSVLLTMLLTYPDYVFMNRGNHEDEPMCTQYEFRDEVLTKYTQSNYQRFLRVFRAVPLATVIQDEIMVVHGGVPRDKVTLRQINEANRFKDIPMTKFESTTTVEQRVVADMTWSDPAEDDMARVPNNSVGWSLNTDRGNGIFYKRQHTESFLRRNKLRLIIRSHEAQDAGFAIHQDGLVVTIFSASYYARVQRNDGAVAIINLAADADTTSTANTLSTGSCSIGFDTWKVLEDVEDELDITTMGATNPGDHMSPTLQPSIVTEVLRILHEMVYKKRHRLMTEFSLIDDKTGQTGMVGVHEWARTLRDLSSCPDLPWGFVRPLIAEGVADNGGLAIPYPEFLRRYAMPIEDRLFRKWAPHIVRWLWHRSITSTKSNAYHQFESAVGKEGVMGYHRFFPLITSLQTTLPSDVIFLLFCYFDKDGSVPGYIRLNEFKKMFDDSAIHGIHLDQIQDSFEHEDDDGLWIPAMTFHMWDLWLVHRLRELVTKCGSPSQAFSVFDRDRDGEIGLDDLQHTISRFSSDSLHCPNRRTTYCFTSPSGSKTEAAEIANVSALFGEPIESIKKNLHVDPKSNTIDVSIQTWPLSENQLRAFLKYLDYDNDGKVGYSDFLQAFFILDLNVQPGAVATSPALTFSETPFLKSAMSFKTSSLTNKSPQKVLEEAFSSFRRVRTRSGSIANSEVYPNDWKGADDLGTELSTDPMSEDGDAVPATIEIPGSPTIEVFSEGTDSSDKAA
eukprot:TRINITY_DN9153_c0_g3_i1.p1 TRINITY_DN9153_c0_g3~~TRINITY_DN9153_c0_g3_i1.p1  ORF type:complete len:1028 (+),score=140.40 TRINITY_DN9153_c0_g3_i1:153-3236(+)